VSVSDDPGQDLIGYGKPPAKYRFKKGRSGNPLGRPRKIAPPNLSSVPNLVDEFIVKEALRPIPIRDGNKVSEITVIEAVVRSMGLAAMKGDHRAQKAILGLIKPVQDQRLNERAALFKKVVDYKDHWRDEFAAYDQRGLKRPEPVPHPDDIVLDNQTMGVRFNGPVSFDEKRQWDEAESRRDEALEEVAESRALLKSDPKNVAFHQANLASELKIIESINMFIPTEAVRRRPGFDLAKYQQDQQKKAKARKRQI
jgi:Family of unknown function (DUF5681)